MRALNVVTSLPATTDTQNSHEPLAPLSRDQEIVRDWALEGVSLFFTGPAGTGKSFLLKEIIRSLREAKGYDSVYVTAPTGIAACSLGGSTLHSFAGMGISQRKIEETIQAVKKNKGAKSRWRQCQVLVIDEVSMVSARFFDELEAIARAIRDSDSPFGGIQLILSGDFFQLPPVEKQTVTGFCFQAKSWPKAVPQTFELRQVFRQGNDPPFVRLLNQLRRGEVTPESVALLRKCSNPVTSDDGIQPTRLYPLKRSVEEENLKELSSLPGDPKVFHADDNAKFPSYQQQLEKSCPAPSSLYLKKGAQVILLRNISVDRELVNGARGIIIDFEDKKGLPVVKFACGVTEVIGHETWDIETGGTVLARRKQIPLNLAWALRYDRE